MTTDKQTTHVEISDGERVVAAADVSHTAGESVIASVHVEPGHIAPGIRRDLVDALLDEPAVRTAGHLTAAVPRGDAETLERFQERCTQVETRPAGASIMVEADTPRDPEAGAEG